MLTAALVATVAGQADPQLAMAKDRVELPAVRDIKSLPAVKSTRAAAKVTPLPSAPLAKSAWPTTAEEVVAVPAATGKSAAASKAGVKVTRTDVAAQKDATPPPASVVKVRPTSMDAARRAGVNGPVFVLDAGASPVWGDVAVDFDYRAYAGAVGADWASRLRVVELPECALSTPERSECLTQTPISARNDVDKKAIAVSPPSRPEAQTKLAPETGVRVLALTADASGPGGSFSATSLAAAGDWSAGGSSGGFSWSTALEMPPSLGGPSPSVGLGYSSSGVDGRTVSTNNQTSWLGEGWDYQPGFVERQYTACSEDQAGGNNTVKTGDLCWASNNVTLSLNGKSSAIVRDDATGAWKLETNDGSRIEKLNGAVGFNGDNDGEYWKVTTTDGTQYFFGRHRLPGWVAGNAETKSVLSVPVFGNQSGEPCHATTFASSACNQAWRWNVDHVVDPHGNTMSYWYEREANNYGKNLVNTGAAYDRAGYLKRIDYGQRSGTEYSTKAPARVNFDVAERCGLPPSTFSCTDANFTLANAAQWPDTPVDQNCKVGEACSGRYSPTFWSRKRLVAVRTESLNAASTYDAVDTWAFAHSFPNSGDGLSPALWLSTITRTGQAGGSMPLPPITFKSTQLANRVDTPTDGTAALYRHRVNEIYSESGAVTGITYSQPECTPTNKPASDADNSKRCYPVFWTPPGAADDKKEYFHKYVVTQVLDQDRSAGQPGVEVNYSYLDGPAWAYDNNELVKPAKRTWNQFRGYGRVQTRTGSPSSPDTVMLTESKYFLGMNGDRTATGGSKPVSVTDSDGVAIADEPEFAGYERETSAYDSAAGSIVSSTISKPWRSGILATRARAGTTAQTSRATAVTEVVTKSKMADGTWRRAKVVNTFDNDATQLTTSDYGDLAKSGDESCTKLTYPPSGAAWIKQLPIQSVKVSKTCDVTPSLPADFLADTRTFYDGATVAATAPTRGLVTKVEYVDSWPAGGTAHVAQQTTSTYDAYGRVKTSTDPLGKVTSTAYTHTPATGGPVTKLTVTNALAHVSTTELDSRRGVDKAIVDANGKRTEAAYDALGRVTKVWAPGRATTTSPNVEYTYTVSATTPSVVGTKALRNDGTYVTSYEIYDGLMRVRQTQKPGAVSGRLLTDVFYDSRGLAVKSNNEWHNQNPTSAGLFLIDGTTTPDNIVPSQTVNEYDGRGRQAASILRGFGEEKWRTTTTYDGDTVSTDPPAGAPAVTEKSDVQGRVIERRRYPSGSVSGTAELTTYAYNPQGQLKTVTAPGNATWGYEYDLLGRMVKTTDPDTGTSTTTYDTAGRVQSSTNAEGQSVWSKYDDLGRVLSTHDGSLAGATRTSFTYDTLMKGYPTSSSRWSGAAEYKTAVTGYDDGYRSKGTTYAVPAVEGNLAGSYTFGRSYTLNGDLYRESFPAAGGLASDVLEYTYSSTQQLARVKSVVNSEQYLDQVLYSNYGESLRTYLGTSGKNVYVGYTYDDTTRRLTTQTLDRDIAPTRLESRAYKYDESGNILAQISTAAGAVDAQCYQYDGFRRLTDAWTSKDSCATTTPSAGATGSVGGPQAYWHSYTYDALGNRTTETKKDPAGNVASDTVRTFTYPTSATAQPHTLRGVSTTGPAAAPAESYDYDAAGRQTSRNQAGAAYAQTWDVEGKLVKSVKGTETSSFLYDAGGTRLIKREPGKTTLYLNGSTELVLNSSGGAVTGTRIMGLGDASAVKTATGTTFVIEDHQGTGQWVLDKTTLAGTQRKLTAFGEDRAGAPAQTFPADKTFVGGTKDASTGLIHIGAREYNPSAGAFISADPIMDLRDPDQMNGYAYSKNSPITYSDPDGLKPMGADDTADNWEWSGSGWEWTAQSQANHNEKVKKQKKAKTAEAKRAKQRGPSDADVRKAREIKKKSIVDVIKEHGAEIIMEVLGINDAVNCFTKGDVGACVSMAIGALPWGKIFKAKKIGEALYRAFNGFLDFRKQLKWAQRIEDEAAAGLAGSDNAVGGAGNVVEACKIANSFSGETLVLMADGSKRPISEIKPGDKVQAANPETGEKGAEQVTNTWPHKDSLVTLDTDAGKIVTTEDHPYWNDTDKAWEEIQDFDRGDMLLTSSGTSVKVYGLALATTHVGSAYNLTVDNKHTYYVGAGVRSVLVHNCGDTYSRPAGFRAGVRDQVWENAREASTGRVRDPLTGRFMSKDKSWDMGHVPGKEFRRLAADARASGMSRAEFLNQHNNPAHYRPELPSSNRSHRGELIDD